MSLIKTTLRFDSTIVNMYAAEKLRRRDYDNLLRYWLKYNLIKAPSVWQHMQSE